MGEDTITWCLVGALDQYLSGGSKRNPIDVLGNATVTLTVVETSSLAQLVIVKQLTADSRSNPTSGFSGKEWVHGQGREEDTTLP